MRWGCIFLHLGVLLFFSFNAKYTIRLFSWWTMHSQWRNTRVRKRVCGTSKHNCLVSCSFCWQRHVSATVGHLQVTKMYIEENYTEWGHSQKGKSVPLQAWSASEGSRNLMFPDFVTTAQDCDRLSALRTGCLYHPGNTPGTHFR